MKKFALVLCSLIFCLCAFLSGCGNPLDGVSVTASGTKIETENGVQVINLELKDGEPGFSTATVTAAVTGGAKHIARTANFVSSQPEKVAVTNVTVNSEGNSVAVITALEPTLATESVYITVSSVESAAKSTRIRVHVKKAITGINLRSALPVGIPVGQPFTIDKNKVFDFSPANTNETELRYTINGTNYGDGAPITLNAAGNYTATATSVANPAINRTFTVRAYEQITGFGMSRVDLFAPQSNISGLKLIKNSNEPGANFAKIGIDVTTSENTEISLISSSGVLGAAILFDIDQSSREITFTGVDIVSADVTVRICVAGLANPVYITKTLHISVEDCPEDIKINSSRNISDGTPEIKVHDGYAISSLGAEVSIDVSPTTAADRSFKLQVAPEHAHLLSSLDARAGISLTPVNLLDTNLVFNSRTTLYFKNTGAQIGTITFTVVPVYAGSNPLALKGVTRQFNLSLQKGVQNIRVDQIDSTAVNPLDTNSFGNTFTFDINKLNQRTVTLSCAPGDADITGLRAYAADSSIVRVDSILATNGSNSSAVCVFSALKTGRTQITFRDEITGTQLTVQAEVICEINDTDGMIIRPAAGQDGLIANTTYHPNNSLSAIQVMYGYQIQLNNIASPVDSSVVSLRFTLAHPNSASVSSPAPNISYIFSQGNGTVAVYPYLTYKFLNGLFVDTAEIPLDYFNVTVFVPIREVVLSTTHVHLYAGGQGYYTSQKSIQNVGITLIPSNSTIQASLAEWTINNTGTSNGGAYISGSAKGSSVMLKADSQSGIQTYTLKVTINDYNRVITREVMVTVESVTPVSSILVDDYVTADGIYFAANKGLYSGNADTIHSSILAGMKHFVIKPTVLPYNATNKDVIYIVYDYDASGDIKTRSQVEANNNSSSIIKLVTNEKGEKVILPVAAGKSRIYVVPADKLAVAENMLWSVPTTTGPSPQILGDYVALEIEIGDGSEANPYRIKTAADFLAIAGGLDKHYALFNSIDLSGYDISSWSPIGDANTPFTGSIKTLAGYPIQRITGIKINSTGLSNLGIFGVLGSGTVPAQLENIEFIIDRLYVDLSTSNLIAVNIGGLAGTMNAKLKNISVIIKESVIIAGAATQEIYFGGVAGVNYSGYTPNESDIFVYAAVETTITANDSDVCAGGIVGLNAAGAYLQNLSDREGITSYVDIKIVGGSTTNAGGTAGKNAGTITCALSEGKISGAQTAGGIAGYNTGAVQNSLASVKISGAGTGSSIGGIAGNNANGTLWNSYFEAYDSGLREKAGAYLQNAENIGGIAGLTSGGEIDYCYARSYFDNVLELVSDGFYGDIYLEGSANAGGIAGNLINTDVANSFAYLNIGIKADATGINFGGFAGAMQGGSIMNSYTNCALLQPNADVANKFGALIGIGDTVSKPTILYSYAVIEGLDVVMGDGSINPMMSVYIEQNPSASTTPQYGAMILPEAQMLTAANFVGFVTNVWKLTDGHYPELYANGGPLLGVLTRPVPSTLGAVIHEYAEKVTAEGKLAQSLKASTQNVVIVKDANSSLIDLVYLPAQGLTDEQKGLVDYSTIPIGLKNVNVWVESSNVSIVNIQPAMRIEDVKLDIRNTGTVTITARSKQNINAWFSIQICVIEGYSQFNLYKTADKNYEDNLALAASGKELRVKLGKERALAHEFADSPSVANVGVRISVSQLDFNPGDPEFGFRGFSASAWENDGSYYSLYVPASYPLILETYKKTDADGINIMATPYINGMFRVDPQNLASNFINEKIFIDVHKINFDVIIFTGASEISTSADSAVIEPKNSQIINVTALTDNEDDYNNLQIEVTESNGHWEWLSRNALTLPEFNLSNNTVFAKYEFYLNPAGRTGIIGLAHDLVFTITFRIADEPNGIDVFCTFTLTFVKQSIDRLDLVHFSDAKDPSNEMPDAGLIPSNTIIAGDYGLLRIDFAPYFADIDHIDIVSTREQGDIISFDQRVLYIDEHQTFRYESYQLGVSTILNGIRITNLVSQVEKDASGVSTGGFLRDGTIYIRTIVQSATTLVASFNITVTAAGPAGERTKTLPLAVDAMPALKVEFRGYSPSTDEFAYIAQGTNGINNRLNITYDSSKPNTQLLIGDIVNVSGATGVTIDKDARTISVSNSTTLGATFDLTVRVVRIINGYQREVSVTIRFKVVNFVVYALGIEGVSGNIYSKEFAAGREYNLRVTLEATKAINGISYSDENESAVTAFINGVNRVDDITGVGNWEMYLNGQPSQDTSKLYYNDTRGNYVFKPDVAGNADTVRLRVRFQYGADGIVVLRDNEYNDTPPKVWEINTVFNLNFYQSSSLDHPIPVFTAAELRGMEAGRNYILLDNIDLRQSDYWAPLNVAIASLDGNGKSIFVPPSFSTSGAATDQQELGLFGIITEDTIIKNLNIVIAGDIYFEQNLIGYTTVNFGMLAGANYGTVTNCAVYTKAEPGLGKEIRLNSSRATGDLYYVGGLIGVNYGYITNSRVQNVDLTAYGNVAGLVAQNNMHISACYYSFGKITNTASSLSGNVSTAGLVGQNSSGATVLQSYAGSKPDGTNYQTKIDSGARAGGFVYQNYGTISDCYSEVDIQASAGAAGFVYINNTSGVVERCYSVSKLPFNNVLQTPFTGFASSSVINNFGSISDCFYLSGNYPSLTVTLEKANALNADEFRKPEAFANFGLSRTLVDGLNGYENHEYSGVWTILNSQHTYFSSGTGPQLVAANLIATPSRVLNAEKSVWDPSSLQMKYEYDNEETIGPEPGERFSIGNGRDIRSPFDGSTVNVRYNPFLVSSAQELNRFAGSEFPQFSTSAVRLIRPIDLNDLTELNVKLKTTEIVFEGEFDGNGLLISNLEISMQANINAGSAGLFKEIKTEDVTESAHDLPWSEDQSATVRNVVLQVSNILAGNTTYVGALAGKASSAFLANITVTGSNVILGRNLVGGVVGYLTGASRAININSNISASAVYSQSGELGTNLYSRDLYEFFEFRDNSTPKQRIKVSEDLNTKLNYAGGVFGVADLVKNQGDEKDSLRDLKSSIISNVRSYGNSKIIGETAGGVFGLVGANTFVTNAHKIADREAYVKGAVFTGGLAGENRGIIDLSSVNYAGEMQAAADTAQFGALPEELNANFFQGSPKAAGGLVGLNLGAKSGSRIAGVINNSHVRIHVLNVNAQHAGGIAGIMSGGDIKAVYTTGAVRGSNEANVGGLIGSVYDFMDLTMGQANLGLFNNPYTFTSNSNYEVYYNNSNEIMRVTADTFKTLSSVNYSVAQNNFLSTLFTYYTNLSNNGSLGGLIGHVSSVNLLMTSHKENYNDINFYVNEIFDTPVALNAVSIPGTVQKITLRAIGSISLTSFDAATGKTQIAMRNDKMIVYGGWDRFSYNLSTIAERGANSWEASPVRFPELEMKPVPAVIDLYSKEQVKQIYWHMDRDYRIMNDITLGYMMPIGDEFYPFTGKLYSNMGSNRNAFTFKGMQLDSQNLYTGLFGATRKAEIRDIMFEDVTITATLYQNVNTFVGVVAGKAINTTFKNIVIENKTIPANTITTNAQYVGGLAGYLVRGELTNTEIDSETGREKDFNSFVTNVIVNVGITIQSNFVEPGEQRVDNSGVLAGGLAGYTENYEILDVFSKGNIDLTAFAHEEDLLNTAKDVAAGGLVGHIKGGSIENAVSTVNITDANLSFGLNEVHAGDYGFNVYLGGFAGKAEDAEISSARAGGDISLFISGGLNYDDPWTANNGDFYVGGFVGLGLGKTSITYAMSAGNITLDAESGLIPNLLKGTAQTQVGGFIGAWDITNVITGEPKISYSTSITSIRNHTLFGNTTGSTDGKVDAFGYYGLSDVVETVFYDTYMSLLSLSALHDGTIAQSTQSMVSSGMLGTLNSLESGKWEQIGPSGGESIFAYPTPKITYTDNETSFNTGAQTKFSDLFKANLSPLRASGTKINPIAVSATNLLNVLTDEAAGTYYRQNADYIEISLETAIGYSFLGYYNGAGRSITVSHNVNIFKQEGQLWKMPSLSLFNSIGQGPLDGANYTLAEKTSAAYVTGVNLNDINLDFISAAQGTEFVYGGIAAQLHPYSVVASSIAEGNVAVFSSEGTITAGGLVGINEGQIINSVSRTNITLGTTDTLLALGDSLVTMGGIAGVSTGGSYDSLLNTYAYGSLVDKSTDGTSAAGGLVGAKGENVPLITNSYSVVKITSSHPKGNIIGSGAVTAALKNVGFDNRNSDFNEPTGATPIDTRTQRQTAETAVNADTPSAEFPGFVLDKTLNGGYPYAKFVDKLNTGAGTEASPYILTTRGDFEWFVKDKSSAGQYFKLARDINISGVSSLGLSSPVAFSGHLDGNGHYIENLTSTLFSTVSGPDTIIEKLGFKNAVSGAVLVSTLSSGATVSECLIESGNSGARLVGANSGTVKDCLANVGLVVNVNSGTLSRNIDSAFLAGKSSKYEDRFKDSNAPSGPKGFSDFIDNYGSVWIMLPSAVDTLGAEFETNTPTLRAFVPLAKALDLSGVYVEHTELPQYREAKIYTAEEFLKVLKFIDLNNTGLPDGKRLTIALNNDLDFANILLEPTMFGTNENLITLNGYNHSLFNMALVPAPDKTGEMAAYNGSAGLFTLLSGSSRIENLNIVNSFAYGTNKTGLLASSLAGTVNNVNNVNSAVLADANAGALAGESVANITTVSIENCFVDGFNENIGGIVGNMKSGSISLAAGGGVRGTLINYLSTRNGEHTGAMSDLKNVGGIVGIVGLGAEIYGNTNYVSLAQIHVIADTKIFGFANVGGVAGQNNGNLRYLRADASLCGVLALHGKYDTTPYTGTGENMGGIAGYNAGSAINVTFGGFVNNPDDYFDDTYNVNADFVIIDANNVGGIVGHNTKSGIVQKADTVVGAQVYGCRNVGGIMGISYRASDCFNLKNYAEVYGAQSVGGVAGKLATWIFEPEGVNVEIAAKISIASNHADVTGRYLYDAGGDNFCSGANMIGGLVGENLGEITESYVSAEASVYGGCVVGGLAGYSSGTITYCYSLAVGIYYGVDGSDYAQYVGALVGQVTAGEIKDVYANASTLSADRAAIYISGYNFMDGQHPSGFDGFGYLYANMPYTFASIQTNPNNFEKVADLTLPADAAHYSAFTYNGSSYVKVQDTDSALYDGVVYYYVIRESDYNAHVWDNVKYVQIEPGVYEVWDGVSTQDIFYFVKLVNSYHYPKWGGMYLGHIMLKNNPEQ